MPTFLRIILAILAGIILGSVVNMFLVSLNPLPDGVDPNDLEALKEAMQYLSGEYFVMPLLAHALGTLVGALVTALIVNKHRNRFALVIGIWFLLGGIGAIYMLGGPVWFMVVDLTIAYLPMAWIGLKLAELIRPVSQEPTQ